MQKAKEAKTNSNCNHATHLTLPFLNTQIHQQNRQNILRTQAFGDVTKQVDSSMLNALLWALRRLSSSKQICIHSRAGTRSAPQSAMRLKSVCN